MVHHDALQFGAESGRAVEKEADPAAPHGPEQETGLQQDFGAHGRTA